MKVHIKALTLLIVGVLVINIISFGIPVYAAALPSPGIVPFSLWSQNKQDPFRKGVERFIMELFGFSPTINYVDNDGTSKTATYEATNSQAQDIIDDSVSAEIDEEGNLSNYSCQTPDDVNRIVNAALLEYCKVLNSGYVGVGKYVDGQHISLAAFNEGINNILNNILAEDDHTSIMWDMKHINGVPQNEVTISEPISIPCFDYLNLNYVPFSSFNDLHFDYFNNCGSITGSNSRFYTFFAITSDKNLYILRSYYDLYYNYRNPAYLYYIDSSKNYIVSSISFSFKSSINYRYHKGFLFFEDGGHLYPTTIASCYSYAGPYSKWQYTYGNPALSTTHNLFDDSSFYSDLSQTPDYIFENKLYLNDGFTSFFCPMTNEVITDSDLLKKDISVVGYFQDNSLDSISFDSSTISTAGNLLSTYEDISIGGDQSSTSDLSDWQKAVYLLAQQYGETYEELLSKLDLIIDSEGNLTIAGADGIEYKVSALAQSFDEIYTKVEDISGDLSELLEYLKSLNIEGLDSYISALEGTLNDLNERDKDQSAVLGGISSTLTDLNTQLGTLNVSGINNAVSSIDSAISASQLRDQLQSDFNQKFAFGVYNYTGITSFKLYDQCKYFLDNLFNYNNRDTPPNFSFYYDSNGDGEKEVYPLIDFSFLETNLTNENTVDKSLWASPIKIIDLIRYIIAIVCYGLFVLRLIKRLPTFYGNGPLSLSG